MREDTKAELAGFSVGKPAWVLRDNEWRKGTIIAVSARGTLQVRIEYLGRAATVRAHYSNARASQPAPPGSARPGAVGWIPWGRHGWIRVQITRTNSRGSLVLRTLDRRTNREIRRPPECFVHSSTRPTQLPTLMDGGSQ
jgi:hypothetical protein